MKSIFLLLILAQSIAFADEDFVSTPNTDYATILNDELITVLDMNYLRNRKASFCTRPVEMIDTIVIHHSETRSLTTPEEINEFHLNRGSAADPWYMIAYSYVINTPYIGNSIPDSKVTVGRPLGIVGAHAGSDIFVPMDAVQQQLWSEQKVMCGKEGQPQKFDPTLVRGTRIKANVTTLGVVVNGNYSLLSRSNPNGNRPAKTPSVKLVDMFARLSCQLQRQYPRIKTLAYHNQYHSTSCPGTIQLRKNMQAIQNKAREYGCEFKLLP